jgi:hypothetical protein
LAEPLLVPIGGPGSLELSGLTLNVELACADGACRTVVSGLYRLHNRDRSQPATAQLTPLGGLAADLADGLTLRNQNGGTLRPSALTSDGWPVWEITLPPDGRQWLTLVRQQTAPNDPLLSWACQLETLAAWGTVESVRLAWSLPQYLSEAALIAVEPGHAAFDGYHLTWDYERPAELLPHRLVLQAPEAYRQGQALLLARDWGGWLQHQQRLVAATQALGLPTPDMTAAALAALRAGVSATADDVAARLALAGYLRDLGAAQAEMRVNYYVLAAREIEAALERQPNHAEAHALLRRTYFEIAEAASRQDDLESALHYLRQANALAAGAGDETRPGDDALALRWALALAERGQVSRALVELGDQISDRLREEMLHYAPPLVSASTLVELTASQRQVTYTLRLYAPTAPDTLARAQAIVAQVQELPGCEAWLTPPAEGEPTLVMGVRCAYGDRRELNARAGALATQVATEGDLIGALLAAPWQGELRTLATQRTPWFARTLYAEQVDLQPLAALWREQADYVRWRQIELRNADNPMALGEQERALAVFALREQELIWSQLPSSTSWIYHLAMADLASGPTSSWMVRWGQSRELTFDQPLFYPLVIGRTLLVLGGVIVMLAWLALRRRSR